MKRANTSGRQAVLALDHENDCLDSFQLNRLEKGFREWAAGAARQDVRLSRRRILLIFLLIRYTAAKLNEVLAFNPYTDIDRRRQVVCYQEKSKGDGSVREVHVSQAFCDHISKILQSLPQDPPEGRVLNVDPGFVRRKFYERASECGYPKQSGGPEMIRKARAVEMLKNHVPLPAVQMMLGHSTPHLASSYLAFSTKEIHLIGKRFMERESSRKTSARNMFHAKITAIEEGDIQSRISLATIDGHVIHTVITNDSLQRLGLQEEMLVAAEVKAPLVLLQSTEHKPASSADNILPGKIKTLNRGRINTECIVTVSDTTEICALVATSADWLKTADQDEKLWVLFSSYSVVIHLD